jgi:SAM-dependent methyltransferase
VAERERPGSLVDVGCGNGRDTRYFAELGFDVMGFDLLPRVSKPTLAAMRDTAAPPVDDLNLASVRQTLALGARLAHGAEPVTVYARFLLHTLSTTDRLNFWRLASMASRSGGRVYVEFRTEQDRRLPKAFGEHFRQFLNPASMASEAAAQGLRVVDEVQGRGLAPLENEDPHLCRMTLEYKS